MTKPTAKPTASAAAGFVTVGVVLGIAAVGVVAAAGGWLAVHALQQDFAAYWVAGAARRLGLDPYVNYVGSAEAPGLWDGLAIFRHSRFLYPPLLAELCRPLAALRYASAKLAFTAVTLGAWAGAGFVGSRGARQAASYFVASALYFPLYQHLERGQVDLIALLALAVAWRCRERPLPAGAALALAGAFKPALLGLWPVWWAAGRPKLMRGGLYAGLAIFGLALAISGPARTREYVTRVLPRIALYGEGGTSAMLLGAERFPDDDGGGELTRIDGHAFRTAIWQRPVGASLPRLLAPESPSLLGNLAPFAIAIATLSFGARRLRRPLSEDAEALVVFGTAVACVVTSPTGWVMGLVLGLPLVPHAIALAGTPGARGAATAFGAALVAAALPAPFPGCPALAGAALAASAAWLAVAATRPSVTA